MMYFMGLMWWVVLISSYSMKFSVTPDGKHEGLSLVAGGPVIMGNTVCNAYVLYLKWRTFSRCYSQTSFYDRWL